MAEKASIPFYDSLADIYPTQSSVLREGTRWNNLIESFEKQYGEEPAYVVRAPGRVNILGEHIDYSLFPVLPAAIEQDILLAVSPTSSTSSTSSSSSSSSSPSERNHPQIELSNYDPKFKSCKFPLQPPENSNKDGEWHVDFQSPAEGGGWENYVKVVFAECLSRYFGHEATRKGKGPVGMKIMTCGNVPPGSGLSSSAAMVVGAVIVFLIANDLTNGVSKEDVTHMAIASEHRMGLRTGGMDQAASALALPNALLHLSFFPNLSPIPLPLPKSLSVVICNSLTPHSLTDTAPEQYNLRVVETLCAVRLLIHNWGLSNHPSIVGKKGADGRLWLREIVELRWKAWRVEEWAKVCLRDVEQVLGRDGRGVKGWSREEMIEASGMSEDDFRKTYLDFLEVRADRFHLLPRTVHAVTESLRVERFTQICRSFEESPISNENSEITNAKKSTMNGDKPKMNGDALHENTSHINGATYPKEQSSKVNGSHTIATKADDPRVKELGELLVQSHESCRDVYQCTHPQTDELMELSMGCGAIGARQTGGGWGGAVISLVSTEQVPEFLTTLKERYPPFKGLSKEKIEESCFATMPGSGAGIYRLQEILV